MPILESYLHHEQQQIHLPVSIFKEPYHQYTAKELLDYYRHRQTVKFFPVCEVDQTTPDFIEKVLLNEFEFNHEAYMLGADINWLKNPSDDIEWLILLHKGYYLVGLMKLFHETGNNQYLKKWIDLTDSWIDQVNDPGFIATDVTGRRIQNWIYAFYYLIDKHSQTEVNNGFLLRFLTSLEKQVDYLINHLAPARNHRTLELHAVFLAALVFPEFKKADHWLSFSLQALADNADTDILADGVHCELSTFYHHIVLKNLLAIKRLATLNQITMPGRFDAAVIRALNFSLFVHRPDGQIPSLSDGDSGCFYELLQLGYELYGGEHLHFVFSQGKQGSPPDNAVQAFVDSGYFILRSPWEKQDEPYHDARYLVFDCGPLGAGNHGHLDLLNIEMSAYGQSLIVDPGRYTYDESGETNWRVLFRSTRYHNTVEVDGKNQTNYSYSERKGKYKILGPHAKPEVIDFVSDNQCQLLRGKVLSHEYSAIHQRKIFFANGEYWLIWDILQDAQRHDYVLRYHLAQQAQNQTSICETDKTVAIHSPGLLLMQATSQATEVLIEPGFTSTLYGKKQQAPIIKFQRHTDNTTFESLLFPYKYHRPEIAWNMLDAETKQQETNPGTTSTFCLTIKTGSETKKDLFFIAHDNKPRRWQYGAFNCSGYFCYFRLNEENQLDNFFTGPESFIRMDEQPLIMTGRK